MPDDGIAGMSEMVERVAREIETECAGIMGRRISTERARIFAKVIIEAMRTPTFTMCKSQELATPGEADFIWCAMIDAALKE